MEAIRKQFNNRSKKRKLTDDQLQEFIEWCQAQYEAGEAGEKLTQAEMYEVRRKRIVYKVLIKKTVRDVGHTYQPLNPHGKRGPNRSSNHISHFNEWWRWVRAGRPKQKKIPAKLGYYDFLAAHLNAKGLDTWTRKNCPEIVFKKIESGDWTGHESGAREDFFIQKHEATTLNVIPGGAGKKRKRLGGNKHFGSVSWDKHAKRFYARWIDEHGDRHSKSSKNIKTTHDLVLAKWNEVKAVQEPLGVLPPKSLDHYKNYLENKYEEVSF